MPKKIPQITAAAFGLIAVAGAVQGQTPVAVTSIQFTNSNGTQLSSSAVAGLDPVSDWNIGTLTGTPGSNSGVQQTNSNSSSLFTSTGAISNVDYSISSYGNKNATQTFSSSDPNAAADSILMSNGAATRGIGSSSASAPNPTTLTLSGLDPTHDYAFLVYIGTQGLLLGEYSLALTNGPTYYATTSDGGTNAATVKTFQDDAVTSDFAPALWNAGAAINQSNYIDFTSCAGVSQATLTLTMLGTDEGTGTFHAAGASGNIGCTVDIAGVQIEDLGLAIPEPGTVWSLALGGLGLLALAKVRRNRLAQA